MRTCFVPDCDHSDKKNGCKFTKFPNTPERKKRWIAAIMRADRLPSHHSRVCSCHFADGIKGIFLRQVPSIFRRQEEHRDSFSELKPNARKRLLQVVAEPDVSGGGVSVSYFSGLLSPSVSRSHINHEPASSCENLATSSLGDKNNTSQQCTGASDECPKNHPSNSSSTSHPVDSPSSSSDSTLKRRKTLDLNLVTSQSPLAGNTGYTEFISGVSPRVLSVIFPSKKSTSSQTVANTKNAATQCLLPITRNEFALGSTQIYHQPTKVDMGVQTSPIMFDDADHFVTFGDNLGVVKSLLEEVQEWRTKVILAEGKINELSNELSAKINELTAKISKLTEESDMKDKSIKKMREDLVEYNGKHATLLRREKELFESLQKEKGRMLFRGISSVDAQVAHFTGLPNAQSFENLCGHFTKPLQYVHKSAVTSISREDQIYLTLMKLKCNFDFIDLAVWFNVSKTTVANVFLTILDAFHQEIFLEALKTVPSREENNSSLPQCFKGLEDCRMIINCTEIHIAKPKTLPFKNLELNRYSLCESQKGLVGIAPNGAVTFVSSLFAGSTSDKQVVENSGLLEIFEPGDEVLADSDFAIRELLLPLGADTPQITPDQVERTKAAARARSHVKRTIQRIKAYGILNYLPIHLKDVSSKIFQVCAALTNFQNPLLREDEDKNSGP
ncbi:uncharacterized protein LOC117649615 [Thrips palmi]|uniref:Uncharacterized protein LOC117649615 n=1 Tax=Thrips palmi TaxID=161013 RepID=A0A6P8ZT46_THRPL|nr:uncharacterized protein LOC117649615 [Thrips palmi]XP_034248402.1 uncharacterized protein LOC117649615 [Thrips palmi]XP_034248404.1 uncharacterized protein LOC117649615 [Thrips palmi]